MGCPTETPGPGAPYDKVVPLMFKQDAAVQMAKAYFNHYYANYKAGVDILDTNWTGGVSVAVLRTSELNKLATVTNQVLQANVVLEALRTDVFDYDKRTMSDGHIGYFDMQEMMRHLTDDAGYELWKQAFDSALVYWSTTEKNYSSYADYRFDSVFGMFSMKNTNGITHYIPLSTDSQAAAAYRSTAWYTAAGLDKIGWYCRGCFSVYSWWYGPPFSIVMARYSCSTKISLIIWCEKVMRERESFSCAAS